jgi:hypothetical protein
VHQVRNTRRPENIAEVAMTEKEEDILDALNCHHGSGGARCWKPGE